MEVKTIGVAIATFNGMGFIREQLDSICQQTILPQMISISDDGSEDGTQEFLDRFRRNSPVPMVVNFNARRVGVIENFLRAFAQCNTDYIAYCDQDDVWSPGKLAACSKALQADDVALVYHRSTTVDARLRPLGGFSPSNIEAGVYAFPHFPDLLWGFGHQMVFSRRVLEIMLRILRSPSPRVAAIGSCFDTALLIAAGMTGDIRFLDDELMMFRRHDKATSTAARPVTRSAGEKNAARLAKIREVADCLEALASEISQRKLLLGDDPERAKQYLAHLNTLLERYRDRRTVYQAASTSARLYSLVKLIGAGGYGSMRRNQLTHRQFIVDLKQGAFGTAEHHPQPGLPGSPATK